MRTRRNLKLLAVFLSFAIIFLFSSLVQAESFNTQLELEDEGERIKAANTTLPEAYRSDHEDWAKNIAIKNQYSAGLCWAFATTSAAEYSYAKEVYEKTGQILGSEETSPGHLGWFHYNRTNDPLKNTGGDYNGVPVGGDWASYGGNSIYVMQTLANWTGLASEDSAPYEATMQSTNWTGYWNGYTQPYSDWLNYEDDIIIENSEYYSSIDSNDIKKLILKYGAVASAMFMQDDGTYFNDDRTAYYVFNRGYLNHAVTVIGWDDNYPKENFTHQIPGYSWSYSKDVTTPRGDGAWIIQNSWGNDHDGGKFYISYYSKESPLYGIFAYDMQSAQTYDYNFQYDGSSDCGDSSDAGNEDFYTKAGTKAANIYKNTAGEAVSLNGVGFTTYNEDTVNYTIQVYKGLSNSSDPESGTLVSTTEAVTENPGVKNITLATPVEIEPGQSFSVVFKFKDDAWFGIEKQRYRNGWPFEVEVDKGQSFFCASGSKKWIDVYNYDACFRIKALAKGVSLFDTPEFSENQKPQSKGDLIYTGEDQELIAAPTQTIPSGYTMYYAAVKYGESAPTASRYTTSLPVAKEAGTYMVYYIAKGDSMHLDAPSAKIKVKINKASAPSNTPPETITCAPGDATVSAVDLPTGWEWKSADAKKKLEVGKPITAVAQYTAADKKNYETAGLSKTITITRPAVPAQASFVVKIIVDELNVRKGPGINYEKVTQLYEGGAYTIVEKQNGWGKLKSGIGWINISDSYVKIIR